MSGPAAPDDHWKRRRRRPWILTAVAVAASAGLVLAAWMVDRQSAAPRRTPRVRDRPVADLVAPEPLSEQERSGTGPRFGSQESVRLEQGAWVQVADANGNLKQQYTASRIDPLPDKRLAMKDPRAVLYGDGGRIVTMRSDDMAARVPKRALESGRLAGNVVIRIYRPKDGKPVDLKADAPEIVVEAPEASFESETGEVRCDRRFRILGETLSLDGEGLSLTLSADGKDIERLVIDRTLAPIRINRTRAGIRAPGAALGDGDAGAGGAGWLAAAAFAAAQPAAAPGARLFQLSMFDDVDIVATEEGRVSRVTGDRVDAVFWMRRGSGLGIASAYVDGTVPRAACATAGVGPRHAQVLGLAFGMPVRTEDDVVTVSFKGRLVMTPAPEGTPALGTSDGVRLVATGRPARIEDSRAEATIVAGRATLESGVDRIEVAGSAAEPASIETPDFTMNAVRFGLDRAAGTGASDGPGTIVMGAAGTKPLLVSWATRMGLRLVPGTGDAEGTFRGADFEGDVEARGPDFELDARTLSVEALPVGKKDVPRRIVAAGDVRARGLGDAGGRFGADRVEIALSPNAAGDAQPRTLAASGNVMAGDDAQTLWASALRTTFLEASGGPRADGALRSDVGEFVAEGPVELMLDDGARIFASRLEGDGSMRNARLVGPDVMVVRGNLVLDQLAEVRVQEVPGRLNALGPGRASGFRAPVLTEAEGRIGRPRIEGVPQMQATWRESLAYADGAVKGTGGAPDRGLLLLQGGVKVRSSRDPRETEALDAAEVQIELLPRGAARARAAGEMPVGAGDAQSIGMMRATGEVRLEAREWADARRQGDPRLFRLNAPNVSYDGQTGNAAVDGAGTLLVFDPPPAVEPSRADDPKSPFAAHGTTRFAWKRSLALERMADRTARITLEREVAMDHLGNSTAATGTVTADRMVATVRESDAAPGAPAAGGGLALGGPAELSKVFADGRVVVRTAELDVEAGEFELDVPTQVGIARAAPGRLATVLRRGSTVPTRAHALRWDMVRGTLSVEGARGTIGR
jgi:hypothetical protein